jgi:hypothetical protein
MGVGQLLQDFAKFFSSRCHVTRCGAGDTDGPDFRRAREWAVEQAFATEARKVPPSPRLPSSSRLRRDKPARQAEIRDQRSENFFADGKLLCS